MERTHSKAPEGQRSVGADDFLCGSSEESSYQTDQKHDAESALLHQNVILCMETASALETKASRASPSQVVTAYGLLVTCKAHLRLRTLAGCCKRGCRRQPVGWCCLGGARRPQVGIQGEQQL